jgi:putative transcriptional regulator
MKRNLMAELTEGLDALAAEREGKNTLKHHAVKMNPAPTVPALVSCVPSVSAYEWPIFP